MVMKWFNDLCKDMDLLKSAEEEYNRYVNYPQMIWDNNLRLKQWLLLRFASKWEWLPRRKFMSKDKFEE